MTCGGVRDQEIKVPGRDLLGHSNAEAGPNLDYTRLALNCKVSGIMAFCLSISLTTKN